MERRKQHNNKINITMSIGTAQGLFLILFTITSFHTGITITDIYFDLKDKPLLDCLAKNSLSIALSIGGIYGTYTFGRKVIAKTIE